MNEREDKYAELKACLGMAAMMPSDPRTKQMLEEARQAIQELQAAIENNTREYDWLNLLEDECWDIRCVPEHNHDDADVEWVIIEHHMAEPHEREIGRGRTPLLALCDIQQRKDQPQ